MQPDGHIRQDMRWVERHPTRSAGLGRPSSKRTLGPATVGGCSGGEWYGLRKVSSTHVSCQTCRKVCFGDEILVIEGLWWLGHSRPGFTGTRWHLRGQDCAHEFRSHLDRKDSPCQDKRDGRKPPNFEGTPVWGHRSARSSRTVWVVGMVSRYGPREVLRHPCELP
jgi:hypothetical protein